MKTNRSRVPAKRVVVMVKAIQTGIKRGVVTAKRRGAGSEFGVIKVLSDRKSRLQCKPCSLAEIPIRCSGNGVIVRRGCKLLVNTSLAGKACTFGLQSFINESFR